MFVLFEGRSRGYENKAVVGITKKWHISYKFLLKFYDIKANFFLLYVDKEKNTIGFQFSSYSIEGCYKVTANHSFDANNLFKFFNIKPQAGKYEVSKTNFKDTELYTFTYKQ